MPLYNVIHTMEFEIEAESEAEAEYKSLPPSWEVCERWNIEVEPLDDNVQ